MNSKTSAPSPGATLVWFRNDLRLRDNPALRAAADRGGPVHACYVLDEDGDRDGDGDGVRSLGGASRWWLHRSLARLAEDLEALGIPLILRRGAGERVVPELARACGAGAVFWNRRYGGREVAIDRSVKETLAGMDLGAESFAANVLHEPWTLKPASGDFYKVFTPFWKAALREPGPRAPVSIPGKLKPPAEQVPTDALDDWSLLPREPDWSGGLGETWTPGEAGATERLADFADDMLESYAGNRDRPGVAATSMLSPHLRFGEISPFQVWHAVTMRAAGGAAEKFLSEIGWREFCRHLHFHNRDLHKYNFNSKFDAFPWRDDPDALRAWQRGRTGIPIVDAGMRQLWQTGWMHNRVRMITASFLTKNLMIDWRQGEAWFWDTLVDADAANNPAGWQWVAGCGADAAPYFRIFNPVLQGQKFDADGAYVRTWVPELADMPDRFVHRPWEAPDSALQLAGVRLGEDYPAPIVDLAATRKRALEAYKSVS